MAYSKRAVQPICAVQDAICAVQNEKLCSPKTQSWKHHCAIKPLLEVRQYNIVMFFFENKINKCLNVWLIRNKFPNIQRIFTMVQREINAHINWNIFTLTNPYKSCM